MPGLDFRLHITPPKSWSSVGWFNFWEHCWLVTKDKRFLSQSPRVDTPWVFLLLTIGSQSSTHRRSSQLNGFHLVAGVSRQAAAGRPRPFAPCPKLRRECPEGVSEGGQGVKFPQYSNSFWAALFFRLYVTASPALWGKELGMGKFKFTSLLNLTHSNLRRCQGQEMPLNRCLPFLSFRRTGLDGRFSLNSGETLKVESYSNLFHYSDIFC